MSFSSTLQKRLLQLSYRAGIPSMLDFFRPERSWILMYHGITSREAFAGISNYYGYNIPAQKFDRHLEYLKRRCNVVSLPDWLVGKNLSKVRTNIILTFDDGYENNYFNAFRLLKKHGLPGTFALPTGFVLNQQPLWNDVIEFAVRNCTEPEVLVEWAGETRAFNLKTFQGRLDLYNSLMHICVQAPQHERSGFIDQTLETLSITWDEAAFFQEEDYRPLQRFQIEEMSGSGLVNFASHSVNHYLLAKTGQQAREHELVESKRQVEYLSGAPCRYLCLPGGSYDVETLADAQKAGYERVLTSDWGAAFKNASTLPRNGVFNNQNLFRFVDLIHGPVMRLFWRGRRFRNRLMGQNKDRRTA